MAIQLRILGPLEMLRDGSSVQPTSAKQCLLLAVLVVHANEVVSVDALVEALWRGQPPVTAPSVLQTYVSQLRKLIEPGLSRRYRPQVLLTVEPGYSLTVGPEDLDATRFERLLASGRAAARDNKPAVAAELLREGLGLWRGSALADVADEEPVRAEAQRLDALRVDAVEERLEVDIALGRHGELIGELTQLVAAHPLRERLWAQLMLCLYRVGRQAESLAAYQQLRHYLADELGLDPSTELTRLENDILAHTPSLEWSSPESLSDRVAVGRELPYGSNRPTGSDRLVFVGREAEIDELRGWGPDDPSGAPMALVTGDAGVGKTRVVDLGEATRDAEDLLRLDPPDVANPEHVWQLSGRGLDDRFPPLRSLDTFRGRLPTRLSSFVGREAEQRDLAHALAGSRLLTLVGPGGMGKTRLALAVAANAVERFGEGVWFIELAPLSDPEAVPIAVATTLGFQARPGISTTELLVQGLGGWAALIVVDNCEHLLAVAGELIAVLLDRCPNLVVLATSRAPLRIAGEQVRHVGPLDLETDAPALFAARATAVRPDFRLDPTAGVAVREVCRALDGMPLAIELAAARLRSMTVSEVRDRLDQRFRLSTPRSRNPGIPSCHAQRGRRVELRPARSS